MLFASNKKMFSMSRGLRDMLFVRPRMEKQGYVFRGTVEESEVRASCAEENLIYNDFVRAKITSETLYQYPQLFAVYDID